MVGQHLVRCCHNTHGLLFRGSAGGHQRGSAVVCDPNPPGAEVPTESGLHAVRLVLPVSRDFFQEGE